MFSNTEAQRAAAGGPLERPVRPGGHNDERTKENEMTPKQKEQFNRMRSTLKRIASDYQTPQQLRRNAEKQYGLDADEAIEFAYENIQQEAKNAVAGVREA